MSASEAGRRIVCAALRHPIDHDLIITGPRHFDPIMRSQIRAWTLAASVLADEMNAQWRCAQQGFVDQWGAFLTRTEAWTVAMAAGQVIRRVGGDERDGGTLFSENLY